MGSDFGALSFLAQSVADRMATATIVQIVAVTANGEAAAGKTVDILPLVGQIDGDGNVTPHGVIHNVPYGRMQNGTTAIIMDPRVGDIGVAVFASRDISAVKKTKKQGQPGSFRKHDWADAMYVCGLGSLNGAPTEYIRIHADGIDIVSPNKLTINASNITLDADGNLGVKGEITRGVGGGDTVTLGQHKHGTGAAAAGTSVPTAGT